MYSTGRNGVDDGRANDPDCGQNDVIYWLVNNVVNEGEINGITDNTGK